MVFCMVLLAGCDQVESLGHDQHGIDVTLSSQAKEWLVINYWAIWCAPCRKEVPELNALSSELSDQGVRVLGVNFDQLQGDKLLADSQQLGIAFSVLSTDPAARFKLPETRGLPATYIVNPQGQLAGQLPGEQSKESIVQALRQLGWSAP
ncbi:TlpA family protein disulfide reductase [Pseudomonas sp. C27(2019)]|nr:TlpA disulfide reductase family protein [Pseudomonas sp. C27(2019)]QEY60425.1 TlpA family protein disulfide reductase [Pseudomonas sp. C27(2019)]